MSGFSLPPLRSTMPTGRGCDKGGAGTSHNTSLMAPHNPNTHFTAATYSEGSRGALDGMAADLAPPHRLSSLRAWDSHHLHRKQCMLEWLDNRDELIRQETNRRAMLCGREYEKRYSILWAFQSRGSKLHHEHIALLKQQQATQQKRYTTMVQQYQECGSLWSTEAGERHQISAEEQQERAFVISMMEVAWLHREDEARGQEFVAAQSLFSEAREVREWQLTIAHTAYREQAPFEPQEPLTLVSSTVVTGVASGESQSTARRRMIYLMDYGVNEEEFAGRQGLRLGEQLGRLSLSCLYRLSNLMLFEEPQERLRLCQLLSYGACQARLAALIRVQRWWRLLSVTPWSHRRRRELRVQWQARRALRTAHDLRLLASKMELAISRRADDAQRLCAELMALERAAELRYPPMLDYYVFTLTQKAMNVFATWKAAGPPCDAPVSDVPDRLFVRYRLPYEAWRAVRWNEGSLGYAERLAEVMEEERTWRDEVTRMEARNASSLLVYHSCLRRGHRAVVSMLNAQACLIIEEARSRDILSSVEFEDCCMLKVEQSRLLSVVEALLRPLLQLTESEASMRRDLERHESASLNTLASGMWRWNNLGNYRTRLAASYGSQRRWLLALHNGAGRKFVSLDSAAAVITRFLKRVAYHRQEAQRDAPPVVSREMHLKQMCNVALRTLSELYQERQARMESDHLQGDGGPLLAKFPGHSPTATAWANGTVRECMGPDGSYTVSSYMQQDVTYAAQLYGSLPLPSVHAGVERFASWFDKEAARPREQHYQEVVVRFRHANRNVYDAFNTLVVVMCEARHDIEIQEQQALEKIKRSEACRCSVAHAVGQVEKRRRLFIDAEREDAWDILMGDLKLGREMVAWAAEASRLADTVPKHMEVQLPVISAIRNVKFFHMPQGNVPRGRLEVPRVSAFPIVPRPDRRAYVHNGPTLDMIMRGELFTNVTSFESTDDLSTRALPRYSALERLLSREDVCRTRCIIDHHRSLGSLLLGFSGPYRARVMDDERGDRGMIGARVDAFFQHHPPLAQCHELVEAERVARVDFEKKAWMSFSAPLLRCHNMYAQQILFPQFTFGHLTMDGQASYMDRGLLKLLQERASQVGTKLSEAVEMEMRARERVAYMEEITRLLRFNWMKLHL